MNKAFESVTSFVTDITSLLQGLVVLGIVVGILFDDYFGVIAGLGDLMSKFGDAGDLMYTRSPRPCCSVFNEGSVDPQ